MAAVASPPPFSSSASSFLALRGIAEEYLGAARAACVRTPIVTLRRTARGFACAAGRSIGPGSACGKNNKKKTDETGSNAVSAPLVAFDPLGSLPGTSGGGGLYLWGGGAQKNKLEATTGPRQRQRDRLPPVSADRLDRWVRGSVTEIVKRIEEAPFLSYIFANDTDGCSSSSSTSSSSSSVRIEREVADMDDWPLIQKRWGSTAPDGVILVEELKDRIKEDLLKGINGVDDGGTRTWGVLVQGRGGGADCTACYILNTCRVRSMLGCCTHFCLVRAQCYGDSAEQQLRNAWLAFGHRHWQQ